ncbi:MAG: hypothetical protein ACLPRE_09005, partial [Limisphaerales bacterium]
AGGHHRPERQRTQRAPATTARKPKMVGSGTGWMVNAAPAPNGSITEITPGGVQSTFASGLNEPWGLTIQPVPEPTIFGFLAVVAGALCVRCRSGR